jgi:hypothetical protein
MADARPDGNWEMLTEKRMPRAVLLSLAISALALTLAPLLMPESYSWVANTTSESAAQGMDGAWLARLGLVAFGVAVIVLAGGRSSWGRSARVAHFVFGMALLVTAAASARPWIPALPFDRMEDQIHSFAATAMGFAFAFGVLAVALGNSRAGGRMRLWDIVAVLASVIIPIGMVNLAGTAGLLQRVMFAVAYVWYGIEALRGRRAESTGREGAPTTASRPIP